MPSSVKYENAAQDIIKTFAQYGFRKTSMEDIARAAGVSRHSIYKKFGSKETCYQWAIYTYLSDRYSRVFAALNNDSMPPQLTLANVFDIFIGEAVDVLQNAHGTEMIDDTFRVARESEEDWPLRFKARLGEYLERHNYAPAQMAFVLISASKGLLLEDGSRAQFGEDMRTIINSIAYSKA